MGYHADACREICCSRFKFSLIERDLLHINVVRYLILKWYEKLIIMLVKLLRLLMTFFNSRDFNG